MFLCFLFSFRFVIMHIICIILVDFLLILNTIFLLDLQFIIIIKAKINHIFIVRVILIMSIFS